jgi:hypothetical protein
MTSALLSLDSRQKPFTTSASTYLGSAEYTRRRHPCFASCRPKFTEASRTRASCAAASGSVRALPEESRSRLLPAIAMSGPKSSFMNASVYVSRRKSDSQLLVPYQTIDSRDHLSTCGLAKQAVERLVTSRFGWFRRFMVPNDADRGTTVTVREETRAARRGARLRTGCRGRYRAPRALLPFQRFSPETRSRGESRSRSSS